MSPASRRTDDVEKVSFRCYMVVGAGLASPPVVPAACQRAGTEAGPYMDKCVGTNVGQGLAPGILCSYFGIFVGADDRGGPSVRFPRHIHIKG